MHAGAPLSLPAPPHRRIGGPCRPRATGPPPVVARPPRARGVGSPFGPSGQWPEPTTPLQRRPRPSSVPACPGVARAVACSLLPQVQPWLAFLWHALVLLTPHGGPSGFLQPPVFARGQTTRGAEARARPPLSGTTGTPNRRKHARPGHARPPQGWDPGAARASARDHERAEAHPGVPGPLPAPSGRPRYTRRLRRLARPGPPESPIPQAQVPGGFPQPRPAGHPQLCPRPWPAS